MSVRNGNPVVALSTWILVCLLAATGCSPQPTSEDSDRLALVRERYAKFEFVPARDIYLAVKQVAEGGLPKTDALKIAQDFWDAASGMPRTNSNYVYLNFYDRNNRFLYQVYWDPSTREFTFAAKEFY